MKLSHRLAAVTVAAATTLGLVACADSDDQNSSATASDVVTGQSVGSSTSSNARSTDAALTVTDAAGRTVDFDERPERIVLAEGRATFATSLLQDNPFDHVVAYGEDLEKASPAFKKMLLEKFPEAKEMPTIGSLEKGDATVENILAQKPDVVVMTLDQKKAAEQNGFLANLDAAGLKYVFTDFRQKPLQNTTVTMTLLGDLLGKEDRAKEYNEFYEQKVKDIEDRAGKTTGRPNVAIWAAAGFNDCCSIVGDANLGTLISAAGGHNLGPDVLGTDSSTITPEKLVELNPEKLIVTGGEWARDPQKTEAYRHVELGYQADEATAKETFDGPLKTPGLEMLSAPKTGNYYAVYHQFYDNPFNIFALEAFAKWIHPEEFADLQPAKDFADFHAKWLPYDYSGTFFVDSNS